ncbi:MAG: nitrite/sulfite reductase [Myxococcales bacterium]|nr:nitrite/sulfite reductase [Myxococcales bacterium]
MSKDNGVKSWVGQLGASISSDMAEEIDAFETNIKLRKAGKLDAKIFAEARLRRGAYGQRYDNGRRHDGSKTQELVYPSGDLVKGPETIWDAPGMMRIKSPMGIASNEQLETLADLAEEYSDGILHVTTRQEIQLHFVHIDTTPDIMRRLAAVGITTREACGNSVRNVTSCQYAGGCRTAPFDVTPYAKATTYFLLGHKDIQDFGRKFKISFSGCKTNPCGMAMFHDVGCIAVTKEVGGETKRGFEFYVGGGLGAVPFQAQLLDGFVPEEELLPLCQAVCRVFSRLGERKNRARARLKFVIKKLGIEEFRKVVAEERKIIPEDERWTTYLADLDSTNETPLRPGRPLEQSAIDAIDTPVQEEFASWRKHNIWPQPQTNYVTATVRLPLGDFTSEQVRKLTDITRKYTGNTVRFTIEQNLVVRHVSESDLPDFHEGLVAAGLCSPGASTIADIVACPGTDTCKLGISASRGLAAELEKKFSGGKHEDPEVEALHIKASGCFNSCSQHHVADLGFLGVSRIVDGRRIAHFQFVLGGEWANNGGAYGLAIGAYPSKRIPQVIDRTLAFWKKEREEGEDLKGFVARMGRAKIKKELDDLRKIPSYEEQPDFYTDWGDSREYTIGDLGTGECAGEVVSIVDFGLQDAERRLFEAQLDLEAGKTGAASVAAYKSMLTAAKALIMVFNIDIQEDADRVIADFRTHFHDTGRFHDPFAGAKFANYLLKRYESPPSIEDNDLAAREAIDEAQLFVEAAQGCYQRMQGDI